MELIVEMNHSNLVVFGDEEMQDQTREGRCPGSSHQQLAARLRQNPLPLSSHPSVFPQPQHCGPLNSRHLAASALGLSFLEC